MNRRKFLKNTVLTGLSLINTSVFASIDKSQPNLLIIMLRGAADGLSMLVPYNDLYYYELRKNVSIPKEKCLKINNTFGINPALENSFFKFYQNNQAILIPASGQNNNSRSHFQAQDVMEYGVEFPHYKSGFLGRLQEVLNKDRVISFTENITAISKSEKILIPNMTTNHLSGKFEFEQNKNFYSDFKDVYMNVNKNVELINELKKLDFNRSTKLGQIAQFMKSTNYKIGFVDFGDWDTHAYQGSLNGSLFNLLSNLDKELSAFKENLGEEIWNNTLVVVMSEFGRTLKENGNGTDHGHGNLISLMGGLITKSKIEGDWLDLNPDNLHEKRDLPVFHEYKTILSEVISKMYQLNNNQMDYIFPNTKKSKFNLI